jgi:hypothetical protein
VDTLGEETHAGSLIREEAIVGAGPDAVAEDGEGLRHEIKQEVRAEACPSAVNGSGSYRPATSWSKSMTRKSSHPCRADRRRFGPSPMPSHTAGSAGPSGLKGLPDRKTRD